MNILRLTAATALALSGLLLTGECLMNKKRAMAINWDI